MKKFAADARENEPSLPLRLGFRLVQPEGVVGCKMCGCPTHPATEAQGFCGGCQKSLQLTMRTTANPNRTWGGIPFYAHAKVPPGTT